MKLGRSLQDDSESYVFAGRPLPVTYAGEHTTEKTSIAALILDDDNRAALERLGEWHGSCVFRQPGGRRINAKVERVVANLGDGPGTVAAVVDLLRVE